MFLPPITMNDPRFAEAGAFGGVAVDPGDDEKKRQAAAARAFEATIAPRRRVAGASDTEAEAVRAARAGAAPGQKYVGTTEVGGKFVSSGDEQAALRALVGSDNAADQLEFAKRAMPQMYSAARYGPNGPQGGQAPNERAMQALLGQSQQAAQGLFAGDTDRSKAAVAEFEQTVGMPQRDAAAMERAKLQGETELQKAQVGRKAAMEAPFAAEIARATGDPNQPAGRVASLTRAMGLAGGLAKGEADRARGGVAVQPGGEAAIPVDAAKALEGAVLESQQAAAGKKAQDELIAAALGLQVDPKGGYAGQMQWNPEKLAETLVGRSASPEQLKALAAQMKKGGVGNDQMVADMFRAYSRMSRRAGQAGGAGSYAIRDQRTPRFTTFGLPWSYDESVAFTGPQGALTIPKTKMGNATNDFIDTPSLMRGDRERAGKQASALSQLMEAYLTRGQ